MAIISLVIPLFVVVVHVVFEQFVHGSWKTFEIAVIVYVLVLLANIFGLYLGIRSVKSGQRRRIAISGIAANSIVLPFNGFILLYGILYLAYG